MTYLVTAQILALDEFDVSLYISRAPARNLCRKCSKIQVSFIGPGSRGSDRRQNRLNATDAMSSDVGPSLGKAGTLVCLFTCMLGTICLDVVLSHYYIKQIVSWNILG